MKNIDFSGKIYRMIIGEIIIMLKGEKKMKNESGKTPVEWIIIIAVSLLIIGVVIAMLFIGNEDVLDLIKQFFNKGK